MSLVEEAKAFATLCHEGQKRKLSGLPYIVHPIEVSEIIATITDDENVIAAGLLHDVIEDCGVDPAEIKKRFGTRVYALVMSETEDRFSNKSAEETWHERKEDSLVMLKHTKDQDVLILWLGDKLSNMRSFYATYQKIGNELFNYLHQKDKKEHYWYYKNIALYLKALKDTDAYKEYNKLVNLLFEDIIDECINI